MRLRNIKGSREVIGASSYVVHEEETKAGTWHEIFGNDHPIYIEVGMGKGQFIMQLAKRHPENNYVGIEKYSSVLLRALEKMDKEGSRFQTWCLSAWMQKTSKKYLQKGKWMVFI